MAAPVGIGTIMAHCRFRAIDAAINGFIEIMVLTVAIREAKNVPDLPTEAGPQRFEGGNRMRQYSALPNRPLQPRTGVHSPCQVLPPSVTLEDPALAVMTDFQKVTAFTIDPDVSVDTAARVMCRRKVHLLLVMSGENHVLGRSYGLLAIEAVGERPEGDTRWTVTTTNGLQE
jgi:hypothetical protein